MIIKRELPYTEKYLPSPRHRKLRSRIVNGEFSAEIPECTASDAPVVLKVHGLVQWADGIQVDEYRWYNNQLYTLVRRDEYYACDNDAERKAGIYGKDLVGTCIFNINNCSDASMSQEEVAQEFKVRADKFLFIDGVTWLTSPTSYEVGFQSRRSH